jgi:hypothetical protein
MTSAPAAQVTPLLESTFVEHLLPVIGPIAEDVGIRAERISMRGLQVMFWLRNQHPILRPDLLRVLVDWRGTGRSELAALVPVDEAPVFIDDMVSAELLWEMGSPKRLLVSPKGIALLLRLHPGFEDLDFPSRLARWANEGLGAQVEIERHLRGIASRQQGFQASSERIP